MGWGWEREREGEGKKAVPSASLALSLRFQEGRDPVLSHDHCLEYFQQGHFAGVLSQHRNDNK